MRGENEKGGDIKFALPVAVFTANDVVSSVWPVAVFAADDVVSSVWPVAVFAADDVVSSVWPVAVFAANDVVSSVWPVAVPPASVVDCKAVPVLLFKKLSYYLLINSKYMFTTKYTHYVQGPPVSANVTHIDHA